MLSRRAIDHVTLAPPAQRGRQREQREAREGRAARAPPRLARAEHDELREARRVVVLAHEGRARHRPHDDLRGREDLARDEVAADARAGRVREPDVDVRAAVACVSARLEAAIARRPPPQNERTQIARPPMLAFVSLRRR